MTSDTHVSEPANGGGTFIERLAQWIRLARRRLVWGIAVAGLIVVAILVYRSAVRVEPLHYATVPASRGPLARSVTASGIVNPVVTVQVGTYVSGVIQELHCDFNTQVKKGQLCAKIDPRPYSAIVNQDKANLENARAQLGKDQAGLTYAKLAYERGVQLVKRGFISQDNVDSAKSTFDQAQAQIALDEATILQRQAVLDAAQINLDYTNILSPVDGTVVSRSIDVGQTVAASFQTPTLFLIANDLTKMQIDTNVSESDIGGIALGDQASFTVEAFLDHPFLGEVTQIRQAPITVQNVVTYDAVVSVSNPELLLKPGMTATTKITIARRDDVLHVPAEALRYAPQGFAAISGDGGVANAQVWVLRDGTPTSVAVSTGLVGDNDVEVTGGGLHVGDRVIISEAKATATSRGQARSALTPPRL